MIGRRRASYLTLASLGAVLVAACQDDVATPFPDGLEPLEDNQAPDPPRDREMLLGAFVDGDFVRVHGRGYVFAEPAAVWAATKVPEAMVPRCSTSEQTITAVDNEPAYEFSFAAHYIVRDLLTVEWDDQWRYGTIFGTPDAPELGMVRHQKVQGSDFITLSTGTIQVLATDDPAITELQFVEHLDAVSGSATDVALGMQANYDALVALAHGGAIPPCP